MLAVQLVVDSIDPASTCVRIIILEPSRVADCTMQTDGHMIHIYRFRRLQVYINKKVVVCLSVSSKLCYRRGDDQTEAILQPKFHTAH